MPRIPRRLVALVLFLYLSTLGVAFASSFISPKAVSLICTSAGYKLVSLQDGDPDSKGEGASHLLDCSFCLASGITSAPPQQDAPPPAHTLSYALRAIPSARLAAIVAAPARGPPAFH
ncbi:MAG: DUF2946 family protein [Burkholderiaceae bacterium]|nr:DUF2946 family protein [Burkholderiaceae bacterium]